MILTLKAQLSPGSDLGYLLHKHPERLFQAELPFGQVRLFYPKVEADFATMALWLEVDPVGLVRLAWERGCPTQMAIFERPVFARLEV